MPLTKDKVMVKQLQLLYTICTLTKGSFAEALCRAFCMVLGNTLWSSYNGRRTRELESIWKELGGSNPHVISPVPSSSNTETSNVPVLLQTNTELSSDDSTLLQLFNEYLENPAFPMCAIHLVAHTYKVPRFFRPISQITNPFVFA